jgi:hypothetical protein
MLLLATVLLILFNVLFEGQVYSAINNDEKSWHEITC